MTVAEILNSVKFVVEPNGHQSAVIVDLEVWEQSSQSLRMPKMPTM
jgi:hypothetical protein